MQGVYLGDDPRKHWWEREEVKQGKERRQQSFITKQVTTVGIWSSVLSGTLGASEILPLKGVQILTPTHLYMRASPGDNSALVVQACWTVRQGGPSGSYRKRRPSWESLLAHIKKSGRCARGWRGDLSGAAVGTSAALERHLLIAE